MAAATLLAAGYLSAILRVAEGDPALLAREAVEAELRRSALLPSVVQLREVVVFRQSMPDTVAVCGEVSGTGSTARFAAFAAVVSLAGGQGARLLELHRADGESGPARTRAESWLRCTDETRRLAPAPRPAAPAPAAMPAPAARATAAEERTVTMRQGGNLRSGPGDTNPVLRTLPRGTTARVFAEGPGGWVQIGDSEPWGWVHVSLLVAPPR